jgi:hypothetical protein
MAPEENPSPEDRLEGEEELKESLDAAVIDEEDAVRAAADFIVDKYEVEKYTVEDAKQAKIILTYLEKFMSEKDHLNDSIDRLGNLPSSLMKTRNDREKFLINLNKILETAGVLDGSKKNPEDLIEIYRTFDKPGYLLNSKHIPQQLKESLVYIIMEEGERPPIELFKQVKIEMEANSELSPVDAVQNVINSIKDSQKQNDKPRAQACAALLRRAFPVLEERGEFVQDYLRIGRLPSEYDNRNRFNEIVEILKRNGVDTSSIEEKAARFAQLDEDDDEAFDLEEEIGDALHDELLPEMVKKLVG